MGFHAGMWQVPLATLPVELNHGAVAVPSYMQRCLSLSTGTGKQFHGENLFSFPRSSGGGALVSFPWRFNFGDGCSSGALPRLYLELALGHPRRHLSLPELSWLHWEGRATGKGIADWWFHEESRKGTDPTCMGTSSLRSAVGGRKNVSHGRVLAPWESC